MSGNWETKIAWLKSAEGAALLERLAAAGPEQWARPAFVVSLRRETDADTAGLALRLAEARRRAAGRFPEGGRLFFTPELLEQASSHPPAAWRARRIAEAGGRVLDLGCGAGGDLSRLALAGAEVLGLERDPLAAALARANLDALGLEGKVLEADFPGSDLPAHEILFADPARREPGRRPGGSGRRGRRADPAGFSPAPPALRAALEAARGWCVKWGPALDLSHEALTAPGAVLEGLAREDYELELVSWKGELREALLWGGDLRRAGCAATVIVGGLENFQASRFEGDPSVPPPETREPATYVFEPDPALIRSGLLNDYVRRHDLGLLASGIAYLTGERLPRGPFLRVFPRLESIEFSLSRLQEALDRQDAGELILKKRGFPQAPEELRSRLILKGTQKRIVLIHRELKGHSAHICSAEEDYIRDV